MEPRMLPNSTLIGKLIYLCHEMRHKHNLFIYSTDVSCIQKGDILHTHFLIHTIIMEIQIVKCIKYKLKHIKVCVSLTLSSPKFIVDHQWIQNKINESRQLYQSLFLSFTVLLCGKNCGRTRYVTLCSFEKDMIKISCAIRTTWSPSSPFPCPHIRLQL